MLKLKTNPVGIDAKIQEFQVKLHDALLAKWGLQDGAFKCFGRVNRNKKNEGYIAEFYEGNGEYKDAYWDDEYSLISFFGLNNVPIKHDIIEQAFVHLVFFVNLQKLKPLISHRPDEEIRLDVMNYIGKGMYGFVFQSVELGIENVLKEYAASWRTADKYTALKNVDMHPIHCFRLNFFVQYDKNYCTSLKIK